MILIALELIHDMRGIRELEFALTISQDILVSIFRNRETRCGDSTDFEVATRFLNETYLTGKGMKTGIHLKYTLVTPNRVILISPFVSETFRSDTGQRSIGTAVLGLNMCIGAIECEISISIVTTGTAVIGSEAHLQRTTMILHEVDTNGSPIFPYHIIAMGRLVPSRFLCR